MLMHTVDGYMGACGIFCRGWKPRGQSCSLWDISVYVWITSAVFHSVVEKLTVSVDLQRHEIIIHNIGTDSKCNIELVCVKNLKK